MSTQLAFAICGIGVLGLFYLNRNKGTKTSKVLWLPVIWLALVGSRPVSMWLGMRSAADDTLGATLEGSPADAAIYALLMALGVIVIFRRWKVTRAYLKEMSVIGLYFFYCLLSVAWAPYPDPAFKRWTKDVGDVVMVLIVITDNDPVAALQRLMSRVGFVLFPLSIVMIRYTGLGRAFDPEGGPMNTGVTTNKNSLGLIAFVISLGTVWSVRSLLKHRDERNRNRRLLAQSILLAFGFALLWMAHSSTSIACFLLGTGLLIATGTRSFRGQPKRVHALCLVMLSVGGLMLLGGGLGWVTGALGRQSTLSGRTDIWAALLPAAANPMFGSGFDSFWTSPAAEAFHNNLLHWWKADQINEAHNGYIEVYLNLGWVGVALISLILVTGYRRAVASIRKDPPVGGLMVGYIVSGAFYGITEAGFRTMSPSWIFVLMAITSSIGITSGLWGKVALKKNSLKQNKSLRTGNGTEVSPAGGSICTSNRVRMI